MPERMYGCVASFQPTGATFCAENSNTPTALVPDLSSNCAAALSSTPVITSEKDNAFIRAPWGEMRSRLPSRGGAGLPHHDSSRVARNDFHRQTVLRKLGVSLRLHDGESTWLA